MSRELIEVLILAAVAVIVIGRFFSVLGQRRGSDGPAAPQQAPRPATFDAGASAQPFPLPTPAAAPPEASVGVASILALDATFDPATFVAGARSAYELIVTAFAAGDREALGPLLSPRVYESYAKAITDRDATGGKGPELIRLKTAEITDAIAQDNIARVAVRFEAELAEGEHGLRETKERWTFERDMRSRDPNWRLAGVAQA